MSGNHKPREKTSRVFVVVLIGALSSSVFFFTTGDIGLISSGMLSDPLIVTVAVHTGASASSTLSLLDVVSALAADFLALAFAVLPLPVFHRIHHALKWRATVRRAFNYVTYVIEPKMKPAESMLLYLA